MAILKWLVYIPLFFKTFLLGHPNDSAWTTFLLWVLRLVSFSLIFRTHLGPWILQLVSKRLRVRSISLRSIRGIYFRSGTGIWRVRRIGLSYRRRSAEGEGASHFSIKVEGLSLEVGNVGTFTAPQPNSTSLPSLGVGRPASAVLAHIWSAAWSVFTSIYVLLDPYLRPPLRTASVGALRLIIQALPALTQILDFEMDSAVVTFVSIAGVKIELQDARLRTKVTLIEPGIMPAAEIARPKRTPRHRRFSSVADWNSRLTSSVRRAWDRAWDKTQVAASIHLQVKELAGIAQSLHPDETTDSSYFDPKQPFFKVPSLDLAASLLFSHNGIQPHSIEVLLGIGMVTLDVDITRRISSMVKKAREYRPEKLSTSQRDTLSPSSAVSLRRSYRYSSAFITSPLSPLGNLSASMRLRWSTKLTPVRKLERSSAVSRLSYLRSVGATVAGFHITHRLATSQDDSRETVTASISKVNVSAALSYPDKSNLHRELLGREDRAGDSLVADVYALNFSMHRLHLDRTGCGTLIDRLRILSIGLVNADVLVSEWPSPWLHGTSFLSGDPNSQLLAVMLSCGDIQMTERLEVVEKMMSHIKSPKSSSDKIPFLPAVLTPVPRVVLGVQLGEICVRLISSGSQGREGPFALEAHTRGLTASLSSRFQTLPHSKNFSDSSNDDHLRLNMNLDFSAELKRTFVNVRFGSAMDDPHHHADGPGTPQYSGEPILSLDSVQLDGQGRARGDIVDETYPAITIDIPSLYVDARCATDALSFELWHPGVISAISKITDSLSHKSLTQDHAGPTQRLLDQLPFGLSVSLSLARLMLFVTGQDINPDEDLNISRGAACYMGISMTFCAMKHIHTQSLPRLSDHAQRRLQLSLPVERSTEIAAETASSEMTQDLRARFQVAVWDMTMRDALATAFAADDPYSLGDELDHIRSRRYLNIGSINADISLSGQRPAGTARPGIQDDCCISVTVSSIHGSIRLFQAYGLLLAIHTLKSFSPKQRNVRPPVRPPSLIAFSVHCIIDDLQLLWEFPLRSKLFTRTSGLSYHLSPTLESRIKWENVILAVPQVGRLGIETKERWEELARLSHWQVNIESNAGPLLIVAEGDSAHLRIPYDYILADLILDITVTLKSVRHLVLVTSAGYFQTPPDPEAENEKILPDIVFRIRSLTVEAADDHLEAKLGLIWRAGAVATQVRLERDHAFDTKVASIHADHESPVLAGLEGGSDFQFSPKHSVSIDEARTRLHQIHSMAWRSTYNKSKNEQARREAIICRRSVGKAYSPQEPDLIFINPLEPTPPLFRLALEDVMVHLTPPSFPLNEIPDFLFDAGDGIPRNTQYSLLVPMHLDITASSLRMGYREYPLPLFNIPTHSDGNRPSLEFKTDLVIAEEMGTGRSVSWVPCDVVEQHNGVPGAAPLSISVAKTIMPVKTYARPIVRVTADDVTDISWGVSYSPVTQDLMRVLDTLTHPPLDESPPIGFWDKLRLVFHWRIRITFHHDIHLHLKGSHNPYEIDGLGSGFALCWRGNPELLIGQPNDQGELMQVVSDSMFVVIPDFEKSYNNASVAGSSSRPHRFKNICGKLGSGVRFGVGVVLERACGPECFKCSGKSFDRECRFFQFRPHHEVILEQKIIPPDAKSRDDSYNGFRSDFIHLSISLTSSVRKLDDDHDNTFSNFHLSPEVFTQFWAWFSLFGGVSLPIRQGSYYTRKRPLSPKFGEHLATLKYRIALPRLFISHTYVDNSQNAWIDGVTPFVGIKALIDHFQVDMHQRDQESSRMTPGGMKTTHHKPFYAVEVVMKNLDLRTMLAIFSEPLKQSVSMDPSSFPSNYRQREIPSVDPQSNWIDMDDFVDADWTPSANPTLHLLPAAFCPRFTYFMHSVDLNLAQGQPERSKFGDENTHVCYLGKEESVPQIQIGLATKRIEELRAKISKLSCSYDGPSELDQVENQPSDNSSDLTTVNNLRKMVTLLEVYIARLHEVDATSRGSELNGAQSYYMPSDSVSPEEWAEFDHVYQVHCPQIFIDNSIRDIMMQYYHCSRQRRGIEYHMATRAVKFIRDQALAALVDMQREETIRGPSISTQAAAAAMRKILTGDSDTKTTIDISDIPMSDSSETFDPLRGWAEGVSLKKSHFCLLLKPQIVLRSEASVESVCVLAAVQGKLKSFAIMDDANADDPVCGKVMSRNNTSITGLQAFSPSAENKAGEGCLPLEVMIDLRCESSAFDRLVPQTDATFHYDKFNRLRLQSNVSSVVKTRERSDYMHNHLQHQTDLFRIHVPKFTISANDRHFEAISNIITNLVLFSDAAHKIRSDRLQKMLFSYDFTNLGSAADVIANLQSRLRQAVQTRRNAVTKLLGRGDDVRVEFLKVEAHILLLAEELDYVFEAIKLAQEKTDDHSDQKSALLLHASSSEISWNMFDRQVQEQLIAKLAVRRSDFYWLNRQDGSTVNKLVVGDLQAFDGAADAEWTEILVQYDEPAHHPLVKRKLFLVADWTVLPPVGGITIYESFELDLHPMRLQIDTRVGSRIMEYVWPARRNRNKDIEVEQSPMTELSIGPEILLRDDSDSDSDTPLRMPLRKSTRSSFDLPPRTLDSNRLAAPSPLRRIGTSRSFTDLRTPYRQDSGRMPSLYKTRSSEALVSPSKMATTPSNASFGSKRSETTRTLARREQEIDDATEMRTRSAQKTFVWVRIPSLHIMLSIMKEDSFLCHDARIRTRDLEYRNQTSSFEELVDQFIPSDLNWRGWMRMAFQQPLVPVLPVARELIAKTKFIATKHRGEGRNHLPTPKATLAAPRHSTSVLQKARPQRKRSASQGPSQSLYPGEPLQTITSGYVVAEPEDIMDVPPVPPIPDSVDTGKSRRPRVLSVFSRRHKDTRQSFESDIPSRPSTSDLS